MSNSELPAFPLDGNHTGHPDSLGLTKREYFAVLAMQGMLANTILVTKFNTEKLIMAKSLEMADELLKQLEL